MKNIELIKPLPKVVHYNVYDITMRSKSTKRIISKTIVAHNIRAAFDGMSYQYPENDIVAIELMREVDGVILGESQ